MKKKDMPTPDEHRVKYFAELEKVTHTNIRCPDCEEEMLYSGNCIYTTNPPMRDIHCPKCKYSTTIYC